MSTPAIVSKFITADEFNFTPGERSLVAWISTDNCDREGDVVLADGIDYKSEYLDTNPVVMAVHNYQQWPIGTCDVKAGGWIKPRKGKGFNGLVSKMYFDTDEVSEFVYGKCKRGIVRSVSIGFRPPDDMRPGEWGPPTKKELEARPDWANASRIIRRCVMIEYSIVPIGMNAQALVIAVAKSKPVAPEVRRMLDSIEAKSKPDPESVEEDRGDKGPKGKDEAKEPPAFKAGHYVEYGKGMSAGCGKIMSIHKGKVPGVDDDVEGSEDSPAAKVKVYKEHPETGKYKPTDKHVGKMCKDLSKVAHPLDDADEDEAEPSEKAAHAGHYIEKCSCGAVIGQCRCASPNKEVRIVENGCQACRAAKAFILPPHRTLEQVETEAYAKAKAMLGASVDATNAAQDAADRVAGVI